MLLFFAVAIFGFNSCQFKHGILFCFSLKAVIIKGYLIIIAVLFLVNILFIPRYGYWACAWGGVAGYGTAMVLSYIVGQRKNPIPYTLKDCAFYVGMTMV